MNSVEYYIGEFKVSKVYLGGVQIFPMNNLTLPEYLLLGRANEATAYAVSTLVESA